MRTPKSLGNRRKNDLSLLLCTQSGQIEIKLPFRSHKLANLLDLMRLFQVQHLLFMCELLAKARARWEHTSPQQRALINAISEEHKETFHIQADIVHGVLTGLNAESKRIGLPITQMKIQEVLDRFDKNGSAPSESELSDIASRLNHELSRCTVLQIPPENVAFYKNENLFGEQVSRKFSAITEQIKEAGNCYALGNNAACVYHLMFVMESGVQMFGEKLKVKKTKVDKNGKFLELGWGQILGEAQGKLNKMSLKTEKQKREHEALSGILSYLYAVKDAWRNPTMHPRSSGYNGLEALNILNHVKSFMQKLASIL